VCGIAGFVQRDPDARCLGTMLARIAHRGPDGDGQWVRAAPGTGGPWTTAFGHRRLAIIDLATGAQPMGNEDGGVVITFNGEIYNFQALRAPLEAAGHRFGTRSDTETIIHHFEQHGPDGFVDLNGMFAFAIWDAAARRLTLARDRMGIKPLFYGALPDGGLVFGSELTAVLAHPAVARRPDVSGLVSYFFSDYLHPPYTMAREVRQLEPGHVLVWEDGRLSPPRRFWRVPAPGTAAPQDESSLAAALWTKLDDAVHRQLIADVPVGVFLSGGLDSSAVATLASAHAPGRMKAFSIGFEAADFDESEYARLMADRLGVEHVIETLHERNLLDVVDEALGFLDQPLADPSFLPTFLLSRLAARHVKVVVGGDGGDELWGGYPTYLAHLYAGVYRHIPAFVRQQLIGRAVAMLPINDRYQSLEWKLRRFTGRWDDDPIVRHLRWMSSVDLPELARAVRGAADVRPATLDAPLPDTDDQMHRTLALDFTTYMSGSVLTKVDRASMAHGLEVRPPILDNETVDWAFSLPSRFKVRPGQSKYLFKRAARGHVPDVIIDRKKKGFGIPLAAWLRGPLRERLESLLASSPAWDAGLLDQSVFRDWNRQHQARKVDHAKPLWALLVLDHWLRRAFQPSEVR
jgi:asparagine synthase (glutamine-hydrolysing)